MKKYLFLLFCFGFLLLRANQPPPLVWTETYGETPYDQRVTVITLDEGDELFAAGYVNFDTFGNVLINKYDPAGNLLWNRLYINNYTGLSPDEPVSLFADNLGGVTLLEYVHRQYLVTHLVHYDDYGDITTDYVIGDSTLGNTQLFTMVSNNPNFYFMLGMLNGTFSVFKTDDTGNIKWQAPIATGANPATGCLQFDSLGNIIVAVFDGIQPTVRIRIFTIDSGIEQQGFNTFIDSLPTNANPIQIGVDGSSNIFLFGVGADSTGHLQPEVHKFNESGTQLWSVQCTADGGYFSGQYGGAMLDNNYDVVVSGSYTVYNDTIMFAAVHELANADGSDLWDAVDSGTYVLGGGIAIDPQNNVYLSDIKAASSTSGFTQMSFSAFSSDSGTLQWNRSFDNDMNNLPPLTSVDYGGDIFFANNTILDSLGTWFLGRIGNFVANFSAIASISENSNSMQVFPNPFSTSATIAFTVEKSETMTLQVYNVSGQLVFHQDVNAVEGNNTLQFNALPVAGFYIVKLQGEGIEMMQKVVVD